MHTLSLSLPLNTHTDSDTHTHTHLSIVVCVCVKCKILNIKADNSLGNRLWWSTAEIDRVFHGPVTLHRHTAGHWRHRSVCLWPGYIRRHNNRFSQHFFLIFSKVSMSAYSLLLSLYLTHTHTHRNKQNKHTISQTHTQVTLHFCTY